MDELRGRLKGLTESVIEDSILTDEFPVVRLEKEKARDHILQRADSLLAETNAAISTLRTARASVERHDRSSIVIPGAHDTKSPGWSSRLVFWHDRRNSFSCDSMDHLATYRKGSR
jgi:hypothetical protein